MQIRTYLAITFFLLSSAAEAFEPDSSKRELTLSETAGVVVLGAGAIVGCGFLAKAFPRSYGGTTIILSPLAAVSGLSDAANYVFVGGVIAHGVYNIVDVHRGSSANRRFWVTIGSMVAIPLLGNLVEGIIGKKNDRDVAYSFVVEKKQVFLLVKMPI